MGNSTAQPVQCVFSLGAQQVQLQQTIILCGTALLGIVYACFGYRLFRYVMFITGFVSGGAAAYTLCVMLGQNVLPLEAIIAIVLATSIVSGCLGLLVEYVSLFLNGVYSGLAIGACIYTFVRVTPAIVAPLSCAVLILTLGLISLCRCAVRAATIFATSVSGSFAVVLAADYFLASASFWRTLVLQAMTYYLALTGVQEAGTSWQNATNSTNGSVLSEADLTQTTSNRSGLWDGPWTITIAVDCAIVPVFAAAVAVLAIAACCLQQLVTRRVFGGDEEVHESRLVYVTCAGGHRRGAADSECDSSSESASIVNVPIASVVECKRQPLLTVQPPTPERDRDYNSGERRSKERASKSRRSQGKNGTEHASQNTLVRAQKFRRLYRARRTGGDVISSECAASIREAVQLKGGEPLPVTATGSLPSGPRASNSRHCSASQSRDSLNHVNENAFQSGSVGRPLKAARPSELDTSELPYTVFANVKLQNHVPPQKATAEQIGMRLAEEEPVLMRKSESDNHSDAAAEKRCSQSIEVQTDDPNWLSQLATNFDSHSNNPDKSESSLLSCSSQQSAAAGSQTELVPAAQRASAVSPIWQKRDGAKHAHRNRQHASALQPLLENAQTQGSRDTPERLPASPEGRLQAEPDLIAGGLRPLLSFDSRTEASRETSIVDTALEPLPTHHNKPLPDCSSRSPPNEQQDPAAQQPAHERRHEHEHGHHKHKHKHHSHEHKHHKHSRRSHHEQSAGSSESAEPRSDNVTMQQTLADDVNVPVVRTIEDYRREQRHRRRREREQRHTDADADDAGDQDSIL